MAETHQQVVKVWIAPGCIVCDACETDCPEVFDVQEETCIIRPEAQKPDFTKPLTPSIITAAEGCPVDVIKFETIEVEGPEPWAGQEDPAADVVASAPGVSGKQAAAAPAIPTGPPDPKWASLLQTSHTSGSRSAGGAPVTVRPSAKATAQAIGQALPKSSPADAKAAAMVGTGFARPQPGVRDRIRRRGDRISRQQAEERRGFIAAAAALFASGWTYLAMAGATGGGMLQSFMVPRVTMEPPSSFRAGKLADYPEDGVYEQYKPQNVWLVRQKGKLYALSTICTHLGCIPNWLPGDAKFKCPCHGSGFYMDGVNFEGPAPRPLERLGIAIEDGNVVVDKSKVFRSELGQWGQPGSEIMV